MASTVSEQMNARMYVLSIVAAIFLPLSFFTGLMGINVGGMPGVEDCLAFPGGLQFLQRLGLQPTAKRELFFIPN